MSVVIPGGPVQGNVEVRMASAVDSDAFVRFNRAMALQTEDKDMRRHLNGE